LFHNSPCHYLALEKFCRGGFGKNSLQQVLKESLRKRKQDVATNAMTFCDLSFEPASHPVALDHDDFRHERRTQWTRNNFSQVVGQSLQAIAGVQSQAGAGCYGHRTILESTKKISPAKMATPSPFSGFARSESRARIMRPQRPPAYPPCGGIKVSAALMRLLISPTGPMPL
jgi:hypothetical protein